MRSIKFRFVGFIFGTLAVYLILFYYFLDSYTKLSDKTSVNLKYVVVHLDLKGSPPKLKYLESLLPLFKRYGVNGILMEYEDSFPYEGVLVNLSSTMPYDKTELKYFLIKAAEFQMEIIPLIQTFGHLEHVLKLEGFQHLREVKMYPDSICPSNEQSIILLTTMLEQVIKFHTDITPLKHFHIGCDEVYQINKCKKCRDRKMSHRSLFLEHVHMIKHIVLNLNPQVTILMWDDMFRKIRGNQWNSKTMNNFVRVEPVYWDYTPKLLHTSHVNLYRYHETFENIWIATAFKGADGSQASLPHFASRFENHHNWMRFISNYIFAGEKTPFSFKGVVLTGWSRYSHLDPLCELLPPSLPSLIMNLLLIQRFRNGLNVSDTLIEGSMFFKRYVTKDLNRELQCEDVLIDFQDFDATLETCRHESSVLISLLRRYKILMADVDSTFRGDNTVLSVLEYYSNNKNIRVKQAQFGRDWCKYILKEIANWEKGISMILSNYYDNYVIEEYVGYKSYSAKKRVKITLKVLDDFLKTRFWDRRSYNFSFGVN